MSLESIDEYIHKYPFLDAASEALNGDNIDWSPRDLVSDDETRSRAQERVVEMVTGEFQSPGDVKWGRTTELLSYPLARILVSLIDNNEVTTAYAAGEAQRVRQTLMDDIPPGSDSYFEVTEDHDLNFVSERTKGHLGDLGNTYDIDIDVRSAKSLFAEAPVRDFWNDASSDDRFTLLKTAFGLTEDASQNFTDTDWDSLSDDLANQPTVDLSTDYFTLPVADFLRFAPHFDGEEWGLTKQLVIDGTVVLSYTELIDFIANVVQYDIESSLPVAVSSSLADALDEEVAAIIDDLPDELIDNVDIRAHPLMVEEMLPRMYALRQEDRDQYPPLGAGETDIDLDTIREHYQRAEGVFEELGVVGDDLHTSWLGAHNHTGWYISGTLEDKQDAPEAWEENFPHWSRPSILPDDFDADTAGRSVYTTNTYSPRESHTKRFYRTDDDGNRLWMDEELDEIEPQKRLPDYDELGTYSLIVDIDLEDEWKARPLPDEYRDIVESRLRAWVGVFSQFLGGNEEDVFVVDSGGGAYVMTPPAATRELEKEFDGDDLSTINNEIQTRMRKLTTLIDDLITDLDDAPDDLFSADAVQNKNRQWKSVLSVHSSLDAVVHPLDPSDPSYEWLSFYELNDEHYDEAKDWASEFTSMEYRDQIDSLVKGLFQKDVYGESSGYNTYDGDDWVEILSNFLEQHEEEQKARQEAYEKFDFDGERSETGVTTNQYEVDAAIANVDLEKYLKSEGFVQKWDTDNRSDNTVSFSPAEWRNPSKEANSCFYSPSGGRDGSPTFTDRKEGWTAGIINIIAYAEGITGHPSETPTGEDWAKAVDALRERGEKIPVYLPDIEDEDHDYDRIGLQRIAKAALALGIADEDDIVERDGTHGSYTDIDNNEVYNETLEELEDQGINHGRQKRT